MTNSKWIRRALLGGVAMTVMAAGAQADDLSALKAQIEALQARVNTIETKGAALPEGVSFVTFQRGHKAIKSVNQVSEGLDSIPESRGVTIAVTPTADLPAPATEITISGYVRALALWGHAKSGGVTDNDFDLAARGQINVRSKTDTAVGQIRTLVQIRNQFSGFGFSAAGNDPVPGDATTPRVQARQAVGEWDFMPNWTLKAGHAGQIEAVTNVAYVTQPAMYGLDSTRHSQVGLHYANGPIAFGFGIENPARDNLGGVIHSTSMPDFAGYAQFNAPGGMSLRATGKVGKVGDTAGNTDTGFIMGVGAAAKLSMINFNAGFVYTKGFACDNIFSAAAGYCRVGAGNAAGRLAKAYGAQANASVSINEATSLNASFGYFNYTNLTNPANVDHGFSVGGNLVWRPVHALQVAAEVDYFNAKNLGAGKTTALVGGLGFWFFF